ncbi:hypothetical protein ACLKMH_00075 [Psychromonas sp. KJ10-10]|uniref:hypothetical protein n=1 Tax=Psychromonas sp. KJ10-10 TaxID=3391823 RepID=UPI0039B4A796
MSLFLQQEIFTYFLVEDAQALKNKAYLMRDIISKNNFNREFSNITKKMEELEGVAIRIDNPEDDLVLYISDNIRFPNSVINGSNENFIESNLEQTISDLQFNRQIKSAPIEDIKEKVLQWEDQGQSYRGMQFRFTFDDINQSTVIATVALNTSDRRGFLSAFKTALIKFTIIASTD